MDWSRSNSPLRFISIILIASAYFSGCASAPPPPARLPTSPFAPASTPVMVSSAGSGISLKTITHIVGPSETLWRISKIYNVDMDTLLRVNRIADPSLIKNGQKLIIPSTSGARPVIPLYPSKKWRYIVIHHTATEDGNAHSIDQLHHKRGFWNGLGYHFLIDNGSAGKEDGQVEVGPRWIKQLDGAHANAAGMNEMGIGVSLVGNYSERHVSRKTFDSLLFLVKTLQRYYGIPNSNVIRHNDVPGKNTECPGMLFPWQEFKRRL